eukprot:CAMPEP_0117428582 /NCGR_PEP_ID=MMETSP0758-20121206/8260_1 /TAXON_ID=63605 /ORGANISM="Percolomonas cosmopolitus, Strain AE-1 (ATCC 50343)" /LENGTH=783 /DNA_ID=CAMNT_0005215023 /DNA_START=253 /DNA_END=2601 /DNA_ORIENTATION=-
MKQTLIVLLLVTLCFMAGVLAVPTKLNYKVGQLLEYNVHGDIDAKGHIVTDGSSTKKSASTLDAQLLVKCTEIKDGNYIFVMNLFDTRVGTNFDHGGEATLVNEAESSSNPLGYNMYFEQQPDGQITHIWYYTADDKYFVNIKVSVINALQTAVVAPKTEKKILENDPLGNHYTLASGEAADMLTVKRTYNADDVLKFADSTVSKNNIKLTAASMTNIHNEGFIHSSKVEQAVYLTNVNKATTTSSSSPESQGFDSQLASVGVVNVNFVSNKMDASQSPLVQLGYNSVDDLKRGLKKEELTSHASLFEYAEQATRFIKNQQPDTVESIDKMISTLKQLANDNKKEQLTLKHKLFHALIASFKSDAELFIVKMTPLVLDVKHASEGFVDALLFILSSMDSSATSTYVNEFMMKIYEHHPYATIFAMNHMKQPSDKLAHFVFAQYMKADAAKNLALRNTLVYAYGSMTTHLDDPKKKQRHFQRLHALVDVAITLSNNDHLIAVLYALKNARLSILPSQFAQLKPLAKQDAHLAFLLLSETTDPDFPFAKEYHYNKTLGGDIISAKFDAELFAGTNFDCSHEYFNYKALAKATADADVFGSKKSILDAHAIYGKKAGQPLANEIFLSIFDKVYYDKKLPSLDCSEHFIPLAHSTPGFSVSYTLWVSIVPVTFTARADVVLDLKFGWSVCDDKLSAMVELIPSATLVVSGSAEVNLLIVRGGAELDVALDLALIPRATVTGSLCEVGFDLRLKSIPVRSHFDTYYALKKCKFLFFDCHWDKKGSKTW